MKELTLNISDRIAAMKLFDAFKGGITQLSTILEDVKKCVVTEDEWKAAKLVKKPNGDGTENWQWEDPGSEKKIPLGQESIDYLKSAIKAKSDANELGLADRNILDLNAKLDPNAKPK